MGAAFLGARASGNYTKTDENGFTEMYGDGRTSRDYTYIDDILYGLWCAVQWIVQQERPVYEIVNLGNMLPVKLYELIKLIEIATGKEAKIKQLPMQPGDVEKTYADISKANELFGYNPETRIEEGIKKYVKWYEEENNL